MSKKGMLGGVPTLKIRKAIDEHLRKHVSTRGHAWLHETSRHLLVMDRHDPDDTSDTDETIRYWKPIMIGEKTWDQHRAELEMEGYRVEGWDILKRYAAKTPCAPHEINLVVVEIGGLLAEPITLRVLIAKTKSLGLKLCPAEAAPVIRLSFVNDWRVSNRGHIVALMEPTECSDGCPGVFWVEDNRYSASIDRLLNIAQYRLDDELHPNDLVVFVRPRKPAGQTVD